MWDLGNILDEIFGGGSSGDTTRPPSVVTFVTSSWASQMPGPIGQVVGAYWTSGINFAEMGEDFAADWSQFQAVEGSARAMATGDGLPNDSRNLRGQLQDVVAYGQTAVDEPMGFANRAVGQIDQTTGYGESNAGYRRHIGFGTDQDASAGSVRQLETLDRGDTPRVSGTGTRAAERGLLGAPSDLPEEAASRRSWYRPEAAPPPRSESDAPPQVPPSSAVYYGRDSSGNPVYVLGTPLPASKPEQIPEVQVRGMRPPPQDDGVAEVHVHGVRPPRPPHAPSPRPENSPEAERGFWNRGGTGLLLGTATGTIGVLIIFSNPVGWVVGLTGALMLASGAAASLSSATELGASYAGRTTAEQDAAMNRATSAVLDISSPGGLVGGVAGTVYTGTSEGFQRGAFVGGLAEGAASLGAGLGRMGAREVRFGSPRNMSWNRTVGGDLSARARNQQVYDLGDVASRSRPNPNFPRSVERVELSHFLPQNPAARSLPGRLRRVLGPRQYERIVNRPFNVTPMWATEHALIDPFRYRFMKAPFKLSYPPLVGPARWARLTPPWLVESSYGGIRVGLSLGDDILAGDITGDKDSEGVTLPPD